MKYHLTHHRPRRSRRAFTFVELMASLIIFAVVSTAGTYLLASAAKSQEYVKGGANAESEVEFAIQRITENIRDATALSYTSTSLTITSPPSPLISNNTFGISYSLVGTNLIESYTNNGNSSSYSSGTIVHNVVTSGFSIAPLSGNNKAFQITISAGTNSTAVIQRTFVAFGRNL
ncbi:MAG TPA: prepilin-type N-terminal cleavage/methylation domain-containing protein [Phycisphaerae bacterium]|nr:prepilin-type N-terminal cleavage/methylation domain-containing protein [Phycisphaerae bacterium]